ncbi:MAG TPA: response regulator [Anaerovoracaceae bacterium]|nr:response regulator [Anaerovoracaceae bacterium]
MRILIAEDDMVSRNFLSKFLSKYGECDLVVDGLETIDAFLIALKDKDPYHLICLDIMMPKVDGVKTLKAIRDLEKQYGIPQEKRVKIVMTTALAEAQLVRKAFEYGCEAYAAKPIDTNKLIEVMEKLGLIEGISKNTPKRGMQKIESPPKMVSNTDQAGEGYFKAVKTLPDYQLEVTMGTGTTIHFDFRSRLKTARFGMLRDEELFRSVCTDGNYLIFSKAGRMPLKITASEFMDLVLIDRTK